MGKGSIGSNQQTTKFIIIIKIRRIHFTYKIIRIWIMYIGICKQRFKQKSEEYPRREYETRSAE